MELAHALEPDNNPDCLRDATLGWAADDHERFVKVCCRAAVLHVCMSACLHVCMSACCGSSNESSCTVMRVACVLHVVHSVRCFTPKTKRCTRSFSDTSSPAHRRYRERERERERAAHRCHPNAHGHRHAAHTRACTRTCVQMCADSGAVCGAADLRATALHAGSDPPRAHAFPARPFYRNCCTLTAAP